MLAKFLRSVGVHLTVDSVLSEFQRLIAALEGVAASHSSQASTKNTTAYQLLDEAQAHAEEADRADAVAAKIKDLIG